MDYDALVPGIFVGLIIVLIALIIVSSEDQKNTEYTKNVCSYEGGTMHDDVCVRDGRVIPIKPQQR